MKVSESGINKNNNLINNLKWWQILLPTLSGIACLITDNLLWLFISIPIIFIVTEIGYKQRILKEKYTKELFNWKKEKFLSFSVAMAFISGYVITAFSTKWALRLFGMPNIFIWLEKYGLITGVSIALLCAFIGWLIYNKHLAVKELGNERVK